MSFLLICMDTLPSCIHSYTCIRPEWLQDVTYTKRSKTKNKSSFSWKVAEFLVSFIIYTMLFCPKTRRNCFKTTFTLFLPMQSCESLRLWLVNFSSDRLTTQKKKTFAQTNNSYKYANVYFLALKTNSHCALQT